MKSLNIASHEFRAKFCSSQERDPSKKSGCIETRCFDETGFEYNKCNERYAIFYTN